MTVASNNGFNCPNKNRKKENRKIDDLIAYMLYMDRSGLPIAEPKLCTTRPEDFLQIANGHISKENFPKEPRSSDHLLAVRPILYNVCTSL